MSYSYESESGTLSWNCYFDFKPCSVSATAVTCLFVISFTVFPPLTSFVSVRFETCGFLFCQNILWGWHAGQNQRMHATCKKSVRDRQGCSFLSPRHALEAREDHQRCQLQIQINYNLEDDAVHLTSTARFCTSANVSLNFLFFEPYFTYLLMH